MQVIAINILELFSNKHLTLYELCALKLGTRDLSESNALPFYSQVKVFCKMCRSYLHNINQYPYQ